MSNPNASRNVRLAVGILVALALLCTVSALAFLLSSCSFNKYIVAAGLPAPDRAFQTGTIYGVDVYVWECYQGKHIVLHRNSSEMAAGPFTREEAACGDTTSIEKQLASTPTRPLNPDHFW